MSPLPPALRSIGFVAVNHGAAAGQRSVLVTADIGTRRELTDVAYETLLIKSPYFLLQFANISFQFTNFVCIFLS